MLAALFLVIAMANLAIPGSSNFVGEFYILNGVFQSKIALAFIAVIGIALAAFYSLRMYQKVMHNRLPDGAESREIGIRDGIVLAPLVAVIVALALAGADPRARRGLGDREGRRRGAGGLRDRGHLREPLGRRCQTAEVVHRRARGLHAAVRRQPDRGDQRDVALRDDRSEGGGYLIKFCDDMTALR